MRLLLRLLCTGCLVSAVASAAGAQTYHATLDGLQEVPPNASPGFGSATLSLDGAKMLTVHVEFNALLGTVTASHIHCCAPAGINAAALYFLIPPQPNTSPIDIVVGPLTPAEETSLNAGMMYVNVHTTVIPGGEIRGQIFQDVVGVEAHPWGLVKKLFD
jgi:hypothetical protein